MNKSKFVCKKCGQGDCILVVDNATLPTDCPYAMYRPEWGFYNESTHKENKDENTIE